MEQIRILKQSNKLINKALVAKLSVLGSEEDIEAGIVKYFLKLNRINNIKNKFINELLKKDNSNKVFEYLNNTNLYIDIYDIQKLFELLIPPQDIRLNGAVYTPEFIVNYIVKNVIDHEGYVCDCSCGSGAFLLGALKHLKQITHRDLVSIIEKYLYGIDISDYSIRRAKILLSLYTVVENEDKEEIAFNLIVADSLKLDWKRAFPSIFVQGGFDFVVGNPPYVRIQDLGTEAKKRLEGRWRSVGEGNYNLYFVFFELGSVLLKSNGVLGYITPNNYFTSLAGIKLRQYLSEQRQITQILNFNHLKLFEKQTYTCITFIKKDNSKDYFQYYYVEKSEELNDLYHLNFSRYKFDWLNNKKWRLMAEEDFENVKKIERCGITLGKFCKIRVGIATLKDKIYFVYGDDGDSFCKVKFKDEEYLIEKDITKKVIKISSIENEDEIRSNKRRIIFPYIKQNGKYKIMPENYIKENFPKAYKYLLDAKSELEGRDKGKRAYPVWYAWGRTQGMNLCGKRFYTRTFYYRPDFMLDEEDNLFCNGYAVFCKKHINGVQKILNSKIMEYYIKKTSVEIEGDYQCYQKNFIEKFSIPIFTEDEWIYLESEKNQNKINNFLIKKYKLNLE